MPSDLVLMDIGATHFSRVELATEHSIPFARDIASLARTAVTQQNFPVVQTTNGADFRHKQAEDQGFVDDPLALNPRAEHGHSSVEETPSKDVSRRNSFSMDPMAFDSDRYNSRSDCANFFTG